MINTQKNKALTQLLWIGIGAIGMFFAGLTSAYIVRKAEGHWMEFILPDWFLYSTITIILSSFILVLAKQKIKKESSSFTFVLNVFFLGLAFTFFQVSGWQELVNQGVFLTGEGSNAAGSFLYVLTLSHLVHLIGGLVALCFVVVNVKKNKYTKDSHLGFSLTSTYWHFLGILWIYLFFFLNYI